MRGNTLRQRIIILALAPLLMSLALSAYLTASVTRTQLDDQVERFGRLMAHQLANASVDFLSNNDLLSLNVMLDQLTSEHRLDFGAIYNNQSGLIAQSGKRSPGARAFTSEINFQDRNLGHVLIEVGTGRLQSSLAGAMTTVIALHALLIALTTLAIWFYGDYLYLWASQSRRSHPTENISETAESEHEAPDSRWLTAIHVKVKPARLVPTAAIKQACADFRADITQLRDEEFMVTLQTDSQIVKSLSLATVLMCLFDAIPHRMTYQLAIDRAPVDDIDNLRKQITYIASMADQQSLISTRMRQALSTELVGEFGIEQFHSSLTGDAEFFQPTVRDPALNALAVQLLAPR